MKIELLTDENNSEQQAAECSPGDCSPVNPCNPDYEVSRIDLSEEESPVTLVA